MDRSHRARALPRPPCLQVLDDVAGAEGGVREGEEKPIAIKLSVAFTVALRRPGVSAPLTMQPPARRTIIIAAPRAHERTAVSSLLSFLTSHLPFVRKTTQPVIASSCMPPQGSTCFTCGTPMNLPCSARCLRSAMIERLGVTMFRLSVVPFLYPERKKPRRHPWVSDLMNLKEFIKRSPAVKAHAPPPNSCHPLPSP
ncbi:hypothetical protein BC826DRAFT_173067 [Russula brevipes]|nr:hypothetical protein BC826DRAFT_173067 [Russula brevipes]